MSDAPQISIVVPVFNEASRVVQGLQELRTYLAKFGDVTGCTLADPGFGPKR